MGIDNIKDVKRIKYKCSCGGSLFKMYVSDKDLISGIQCHKCKHMRTAKIQQGDDENEIN